MGRNITVFGGGGFIGRHVVQRLARQGDTVRVAVRRPDAAAFLKPLGNVGQIVPVQANVRDDASVAAAVAGADGVINLVGVLSEGGRQTFAEVHARAAGRIARAAADAGVDALVHVSAIGADRASPSAYGRSKAAGEAAAVEAFPGSAIIRPSVVFGPEDDFINKFAELIRLSPVVPLFFDARKMPRFRMDGIFMVPEIDAGVTRMQPVYVGDVADAVVVALGRDDAAGRVFELGGPQVYTYHELMELIVRELGLKRLYAPVPFFAGDVAGFLMQQIPGFFAQQLPMPQLTRDQMRLLRQDNVAAEGAAGLADLGVAATAAELILPTYIKRAATGELDQGALPQA